MAKISVIACIFALMPVSWTFALDISTAGPANAGTPTGTGDPDYGLSASPQIGWHFNKDASHSGSGYDPGRVTVNGTTSAAAVYYPNAGSFTLILSGTASPNGTTNGPDYRVPWSVTGTGTATYWITPPEKVLLIDESQVFTAHVISGDATRSWNNPDSGRQTSATGTTATYQWGSEGKRVVIGTLVSDNNKTDSSNAYVVKVIIKHNGNDVTNQTTNIVVGEPANLTAEVSCPGGEGELTYTNKQWSIPGIVAQSWTANVSKSEVNELLEQIKVESALCRYIRHEHNFFF